MSGHIRLDYIVRRIIIIGVGNIYVVTQRI